jgi:hypothetical protein
VSVQESRRSPLHDEWAVKVKQRARWTCEGCGLTSDQIKARGGRLEAAHILPHNEYPELRYRLDNGRALCTFRNRRHPEGLGNGYGCHNAMSGHWGHAYGVMPSAVHHSRWLLERDHKLAGTAALMASAPLWALHYTLAGWAALGLSAVLWPALGFSVLLWAAALAANAHLRHYVSLRPYMIGRPADSGRGLLTWLAIIVGLWGGCLLAAHIVLRGHWISRFTRACLHGLVRAVGKAKGPRRVPKRV